jgi:hypothetical protein
LSSGQYQVFHVFKVLLTRKYSTLGKRDRHLDLGNIPTISKHMEEGLSVVILSWMCRDFFSSVAWTLP